MTKEEKRKRTVIELTDDEDDKPPAPKAKAKAKRIPLKLSKPGQKALRKVTKSKQPPPKNKPIEAEPEKSGEKRGKDEEVKITENQSQHPKRAKNHLKRKTTPKT